MTITGPVYALDLAVKTGVAWGMPGSRPQSCAVTLKKSGDHQAVAFAKLLDVLVGHFEQSRPGLVVKEQMWSRQASIENNNSPDVEHMHAGLHAIVLAVCGRYGVPWTEAAPATVRKHFCGKGRFGDRRSAKAAVLARCKLLGFIEGRCTDDNIADAVATWHWAGATYCGRAAAPKELFLFGEHARGAA